MATCLKILGACAGFALAPCWVHATFFDTSGEATLATAWRFLAGGWLVIPLLYAPAAVGGNFFWAFPSSTVRPRPGDASWKISTASGATNRSISHRVTVRQRHRREYARARQGLL